VFFLAVAHPEIVKTLVLVDTLTAAPKGASATTRQDALGKCQKEAAGLKWKCRLQALSQRPDLAFDDEYFEAGRLMGELPKAHETVAKMKAGAGEPLRSQFNAWKRSVHRRVETEPVL